jgi:geranylgeranyl pyrophosphate synthase
MMRYAADLFDAVQDGDILPKGVSDPSSAIEYASGFIFSAFNAITTISDPNIVHQLTRLFSNLAVQASQGQQRSRRYRQTDSVTLDDYWQATILKSGSIFRAGLEGGAIVGMATPEYLTALSNLGNALGVIRQIIDDCRDVFDHPDTNTYEVTLPLLLLSEKLNTPISILMGQFENKDTLSKEFNKYSVPDMITAILLEWRRRAIEELMILGQSSDVQALETILQDFVAKPWLDLSNG